MLISGELQTEPAYVLIFRRLVIATRCEGGSGDSGIGGVDGAFGMLTALIGFRGGREGFWRDVVGAGWESGGSVFFMRQKRRDVFFNAAKLILWVDVRGEALLALDNLIIGCKLVEVVLVRREIGRIEVGGILDGAGRWSDAKIVGRYLCGSHRWVFTCGLINNQLLYVVDNRRGCGSRGKRPDHSNCSANVWADVPPLAPGSMGKSPCRQATGLNTFARRFPRAYALG